jgi:hypothetical protein
MCFNAKVSFGTFILGTIGSLLLIVYGNPKYKYENTVSGIFLLFIASIQLAEFFLWFDINNKLGINRIVTLITPLLNVGQPTILYLIKLLYSETSMNVPMALVNTLYAASLAKTYYNFVTKSKLTTSVEHRHLKWPWIKYSNPPFFLVLFALNIFYLFDFKYAMILFTITYAFLYLSVKYFSYNSGEMWCFFGSAIPLILFALT